MSEQPPVGGPRTVDTDAIATDLTYRFGATFDRSEVDAAVRRAERELLFVCVHNAGRSQMAAALAEHLARGRVHVRSAGSRPVDEVNAVAVAALAERGVDLRGAYPKPLSDDLLHAAYVVVTMRCGDTCPVFPGKRYLDWEVPDPTTSRSTPSASSVTTSPAACWSSCTTSEPDP